MGLKAGTLLWNRKRFQLAGGPNGGPIVVVDTGLTQQNQSFPDYSPNEPTLGTIATVGSIPPATPPTPPAPPVLVSRVHVIPMAPTTAWALVSHGEPFVDPTTGTVWVAFTNAGQSTVELNALFWDPHSIVGPGQADTYNPQE
jgi:hypothetical protein